MKQPTELELYKGYKEAGMPWPFDRIPVLTDEQIDSARLENEFRNKYAALGATFPVDLSPTADRPELTDKLIDEAVLENQFRERLGQPYPYDYNRNASLYLYGKHISGKIFSIYVNARGKVISCSHPDIPISEQEAMAKSAYQLCGRVSQSIKEIEAV